MDRNNASSGTPAAKKHSIYFRNLLDTPYREQVREWRNQEFVRENMFDNRPISPENHAKYLKKLETSDTHKVFVMFYDDEPAAVMTMVHIPEENCIETGSYLVHEETRGRGYGAITGYARLEYVFAHMPDGKMKTEILAHNEKNLSLQKSFGCALEGTREAVKSDGSTELTYIYTMDHETWEERKPFLQRIIGRLIPLDQITWIEK